MKMRRAKISDLARIMTIEHSGFSTAEAATELAMKQRIEIISDSFLVAVDAEDLVVGYVVGPVIPEKFLYDELFEQISENPEKGGFQAILSLAVAPEQQGKGIASQLLTELTLVAKQHQRIGLTLTCLKKLIPFYERNQYEVAGVSKSQHAGEIWYDLVRILESKRDAS